MKVLVTGGAGFIGSHLVERLLGHGHEVSVLDDLSTGRLSNLDKARRHGGVRFQRFDVRSDAMTKLVSGAAPDVVIHLAAQPSVAASVTDPINDASVNIVGLVNVLEACRAADVRRVVFAQSGGTIYGDQKNQPVSERAHCHPASPYAISKRAGEDYLHFYAEEHGLEFVSLALGNVYGPRQDPHGEAGVVSIFAEKMLTEGSPEVFGDGSVVRDYVFVDDAVHAFVLACERGKNERINVATGKGTTTSEIHGLVADAVGWRKSAVHTDPRPGDLQRIILDPSKAAKTLGWEAWTPVADGIAQTVSWLRSELRATGQIE